MKNFGVRRTALSAVAVTAAGVMTLTGCQNGEDGGGAAPSAPASSPASQPSQSAQPGASAGAGGSAGAAGTAKQGQTFRIGEPAQVPFSYGSNKGGQIELTVTAIEQGKPEDLAPLKLGDQVNGKVPYYIRYSVKNTGTTDLSYSSVGHIKGHLGDGSAAQDLAIIGKFEKCPNESLPKGFTNGQTQTSCAVALAPSASTKVASAEYWGEPYGLGKGLIWK